jgi:hypothetical protein
MDIKQFAVFEQGVQWVVDEQTRRQEGEEPNGIKHVQSWWAAGERTNKTIKRRFETYTVVCATACCLGGNFCLIAGDEFVAGSMDIGLSSNPHYVNARWVLTAEGDVRSVSARAAELTGITDAEASRLFDGDNTPDNVIRYATEIAARYGHELQVM